MTDVAAIAAENARRRVALFEQPYDPLTGVGCHGERFDLATSDTGAVVRLPVAMRECPLAGQYVALAIAAGGTHRVASAHGWTEEQAHAYALGLASARTLHDPEFWFAVACKIRTKTKGTVPFILNPPQRGLLAILLSLYLAGVPVRVVLVKARQWGGSTLVQLFMAWVQQRRRPEWNAFIVAHTQSASAHIRGMYRTVATNYPRELGTITLSPYEGQPTVKWIPERRCIVGVGSAERPTSARSFTYQMLHLSEVGLWKSTTVVNAEQLAQALEGALPLEPETICVLESTAKGVGTFFHKAYEKTKPSTENPTPAYRSYFVGWHEIEEYQQHVPPSRLASFVASWSPIERTLWAQGATVEGIAWYRAKLHGSTMGGDLWRMQEEYPQTAEEAFISSGRRVFAPDYVRAARASCRAPIGVYDVRGDATKGKAALLGVRLVPNPTGGALRVWALPSAPVPGLDLRGRRMTGRYCGFLDIGGRTATADWHVLSIVDRSGIITGDGPEVVAEWRCHRDQDLAAWEAAQVCALYEDALMAVEINSLDTEDDGAGHYATVLDEIGGVYGNLFARSAAPDTIGDGPVTKWGFATNRATKTLIIDTLNALLRERGYTERAAEACDEMDYYELDERGRMNAREGQHDDRVISRAGALWLATSYMSAPRLLEIEARRTRSEAGHAALV